MKRTDVVACLGLVLFGSACVIGSSRDPTTTVGTGSGTSGTTGGSGGGAPVDASGAQDSPADWAVVTCENKPGNTCTIPPGAEGCQRCVSSCCCTQVDACRANAECAAAVTVFNDCVGRGEAGLACLVSAVEAAGSRMDLFANVADCLDSECGSLSCRL